MGSVTTVPVKLAPSPLPAAVIPCGNFPRHRSVHLLCRFPRVPPFPSLRREPITAKISEPRVLSAGQRRGSTESCRELPRASPRSALHPAARARRPRKKPGRPAAARSAESDAGKEAVSQEAGSCLEELQAKQQRSGASVRGLRYSHRGYCPFPLRSFCWKVFHNRVTASTSVQWDIVPHFPLAL